MNLDLMALLPLVQTPSSGCGCCTSPSTAVPTATVDDTDVSTTTAFDVTGMTCGHCVAAVTEELWEVPSVTGVTVDLVPGATSTVRITSDTPVTRDQVAAALDEAGDYHLATD